MTVVKKKITQIQLLKKPLRIRRQEPQLLLAHQATKIHLKKIKEVALKNGQQSLIFTRQPTCFAITCSAMLNSSQGWLPGLTSDPLRKIVKGRF
ncbi:hypothetical protein ILYODFUR_039243 [Ilyodon furcidens]|uniref:Uncharacterized protein n=1 Tax=Ilyodon furcidens TaxID=33524 RepID=A0ABV0V0P7_9TELE